PAWVQSVAKHRAIARHHVAREGAVLFCRVRADRVGAIPVTSCARSRAGGRDRVVVAPVDELNRRAVTCDRFDAAGRAVGRKEHDTRTSESLSKRGYGASVVAVARGAERRRTQLRCELAELREGEERLG